MAASKEQTVKMVCVAVNSVIQGLVSQTDFYHFNNGNRKSDNELLLVQM